MSVRPLSPDLSFHLGSSGTVSSLYIGCFLRFCFHFIFIFLRAFFLSFKDNSTHNRIF
ncbi:hypothetical protein DWY73_06930 [Bacteroides fragilis]|uniref:Transmembrane protein n=2 Tax=Bacteroides fragilis TaxID=817 RepID=A0A3E5IHY5_BACFG|nr:hypothetical protein F3B26_05265 [Bacteroides fragilis]MZH91982.1 hypothetical protein [Enterococcus durans]BAD48200.1 hypothetical protein BF1449 [Bacteroides fragilis YCH46]KAA4743123.1 hypothetical protein F3B36_09035 [Bacteroides fragilis]KAA4757707.1 hypothetical protein F3B47_17850 [Bacteroides fragilis]